MNNLALLLEQQGKLEEAGLRSFVKRGDLPGGRFTKGIFCLAKAWICSFQFPGTIGSFLSELTQIN